MSGTYLDSIVTEIYANSSWVDISAYIVGDVDADWGILGNSPTDKLASVGGLKLNLNNTGDKFSPNHPNMITGWKRGIIVKQTLIFEGESFVKFKGRIESIGLPYNIGALRVVPIVVNDWLKVASDYPFALTSVQTNITADQGVQAVVNSLPIAPDGTSLAIGSENLPLVFSSTSKEATAYSELSKLALTEFGFTYLKKDKTHGETLVSENRYSRVNVPLSSVPKSTADSAFLLMEDGNFLLLEDGGKIVLDEVSTLSIDYMETYNATYGKNLLNKITVRTNPSRVDTSLKVLYSLNEPIAILAGQTLKDIVVYYKNPNNATENINGTNMQTPVATTDYLVFANKNGTGTNLTASLTFTTTYGSAGATYSNITNTSGTNGYITKLQARGYGIYFEGTVNSTAEDTASMNQIGIKEQYINQFYQPLVSVGEAISQSLLDQNSADKISINSISFKANLSDESMMAFLYLDVGSSINLVLDEYSIDAVYFIQSVKYKIKQGGIIQVAWSLIEGLSAGTFYWQLETAGFSELEQTTYIYL